MKINKENAGWIFVSVGLFLLLGLSLYLGISGWFFKTDISFSTDLQIGKEVQVDINENSANAISLNLDGSYLAGEKLPQTVSVKNLSDDEIYLRAKIYIYSSDNNLLEMDAVELGGWQFNDDGYFYYSNTLLKSEIVSFCSNIIIPEDTVLNSNKKYIVTILFESLSSSLTPSSVWENYPYQNV